MLFVVQSRSRVQLFVTPWTAASLSVLYCLLEFAQIHVHWVCNEWMWMNQWMWIKWMLGGQCISIPRYHTRNGVYRKAVRCGMCFSLFGNAAYASLQEWTEPWGSLDSYLMVCGHTPPMKTLLWYPWSLFIIQNRRMEQGQSSPCLKIIPIVSFDRAVGSAHLNSSHRGFFLEAITLHFSICKKTATCFLHTIENTLWRHTSSCKASL